MLEIMNRDEEDGEYEDGDPYEARIRSIQCGVL